MKELQTRLHNWRAENFPEADKTDQLVGMMEELGELCHAILKNKQGIRDLDNTKYGIKAKDAIGDLTIFMMGFCSFHGWDFEEIVEATAEMVMCRDWKEDPDHGGEEDPSENR